VGPGRAVQAKQMVRAPTCCTGRGLAERGKAGSVSAVGAEGSCWGSLGPVGRCKGKGTTFTPASLAVPMCPDGCKRGLHMSRGGWTRERLPSQKWSRGGGPKGPMWASGVLWNGTHDGCWVLFLDVRVGDGVSLICMLGVEWGVGAEGFSNPKDYFLHTA